MPDTLLIDRDDLKLWKGVSLTATEITELTPVIREAQDLDIAVQLGKPLYYDLMNNSTDDKYVELLDGKEYTDSEENTVFFKGLKAALCYYTWSRYIKTRNKKDTASGYMQKHQGQYSQPVDYREIEKEANQCRMDAEQYMKDAIDFIKTFPLIYPLFTATCKKRSAAGSVRLTTL